MSDRQLRRALEDGNTADFANSDLYRQVFALAERSAGKPLPRAVLPGITLKAPRSPARSPPPGLRSGERALEALHEQVSARADLPSLQHSRRRAVLSELVPPCASRYADTPFARRHVCGGQQQMLAAQLWRLVAPQPPGAITARRPR